MLSETSKEYRSALAVKWVNQGVSQQEVAERLEVTQGAVSQWGAREGGDEALKTRPIRGDRRVYRLPWCPAS